ncbi:MAG: hypothetical protein JWM55_800 [Acidimicrobiaceae bacterium]|nr:hypothetical protein [Acidimicrobiaceae bacterium]
MAAGESAREVARRIASAAEVLQKKADSANRKSIAFSLGAEGEEALSAALAPMAADGWLALPDRQAPHGGNFDQVLVGPAGVVIIDAKKWSYSISVKGDEIFTGRYPRRKALDGVIGQVETVSAVLNSLSFPVTIRGFIALVGDPDRGRSFEVVRGIGIIGLDHITSKLHEMEGQLTAARVEELFRTLSIAFPPAATAVLQVAPVTLVPQKGRKLFEKNARLFYIRAWKKSGKHRLYLKASDGRDLGWKNVNTGEIEVTCDGDDAKLVRAVLESATPTRVTLAPENLPKIALNFPGGKLLAKVAPLWALVLIGQEWRSKGVNRLYGTLIYPGEGTYSLGFADLDTGKLEPSVDGKIGKDFGSAVSYLQLLVERRPKTSGEGSG